MVVGWSLISFAALTGGLESVAEEKQVQVPTVIGLSAAKAKATLLSAGFAVRVQMGVAAPLAGKTHAVYAQEVSPDPAKNGNLVVWLTIYDEHSSVPGDKEQETGTVPHILGLKAADAKKVIEDAGLTARFQLGDVATSPEQAHVVYLQEPPPNAKAVAGRVVMARIHDLAGGSAKAESSPKTTSPPKAKPRTRSPAPADRMAVDPEVRRKTPRRTVDMDGVRITLPDNVTKEELPFRITRVVPADESQPKPGSFAATGLIKPLSDGYRIEPAVYLEQPLEIVIPIRRPTNFRPAGVTSGADGPQSQLPAHKLKRPWIRFASQESNERFRVSTARDHGAGRLRFVAADDVSDLFGTAEAGIEDSIWVVPSATGIPLPVHITRPNLRPNIGVERSPYDVSQVLFLGGNDYVIKFYLKGLVGGELQVWQIDSQRLRELRDLLWQPLTIDEKRFDLGRFILAVSAGADRNARLNALREVIACMKGVIGSRTANRALRIRAQYWIGRANALIFRLSPGNTSAYEAALDTYQTVLRDYQQVDDPLWPAGPEQVNNGNRWRLLFSQRNPSVGLLYAPINVWSTTHLSLDQVCPFGPEIYHYLERGFNASGGQKGPAYSFFSGLADGVPGGIDRRAIMKGNSWNGVSYDDQSGYYDQSGVHQLPRGKKVWDSLAKHYPASIWSVVRFDPEVLRLVPDTLEIRVRRTLITSDWVNRGRPIDLVAVAALKFYVGDVAGFALDQAWAQAMTLTEQLVNNAGGSTGNSATAAAAGIVGVANVAKEAEEKWGHTKRLFLWAKEMTEKTDKSAFKRRDIVASVMNLTGFSPQEWLEGLFADETLTAYGLNEPPVALIGNDYVGTQNPVPLIEVAVTGMVMPIGPDDDQQVVGPDGRTMGRQVDPEWDYIRSETRYYPFTLQLSRPPQRVTLLGPEGQFDYQPPSDGSYVFGNRASDRHKKLDGLWGLACTSHKEVRTHRIAVGGPGMLIRIKDLPGEKPNQKLGEKDPDRWKDSRGLVGRQDQKPDWHWKERAKTTAVEIEIRDARKRLVTTNADYFGGPTPGNLALVEMGNKTKGMMSFAITSPFRLDAFGSVGLDGANPGSVWLGEMGLSEGWFQELAEYAEKENTDSVRRDRLKTGKNRQRDKKTRVLHDPDITLRYDVIVTRHGPSGDEEKRFEIDFGKKTGADFSFTPAEGFFRSFPIAELSYEDRKGMEIWYSGCFFNTLPGCSHPAREHGIVHIKWHDNGNVEGFCDTKTSPYYLRFALEGTSDTATGRMRMRIDGGECAYFDTNKKKVEITRFHGELAGKAWDYKPIEWKDAKTGEWKAPWIGVEWRGADAMKEFDGGNGDVKCEGESLPFGARKGSQRMAKFFGTEENAIVRSPYLWTLSPLGPAGEMDGSNPIAGRWTSSIGTIELLQNGRFVYGTLQHPTGGKTKISGQFDRGLKKYKLSWRMPGENRDQYQHRPGFGQGKASLSLSEDSNSLTGNSQLSAGVNSKRIPQWTSNEPLTLKRAN